MHKPYITKKGKALFFKIGKITPAGIVKLAPSARVNPETKRGKRALGAIEKAGLAPRKAETAHQIISCLRKFAERHKLVGGTKQARDTVKIELQNLIVDSLDVPRPNKDRLKSLMAKRMRIVDATIVARERGRITVEDTLKIFKDLKVQLIKYQKALGIPKGTLESIMPKLNEEIKVLINAKGLKSGNIGAVLKTEKGGIRQTMLEAAAGINASLIADALGGREQLERLNSVLSEVMQRYVNREFPESAADLGEAFERRIFRREE